MREYVRECDSGDLSWDGCECTSSTTPLGQANLNPSFVSALEDFFHYSLYARTHVRAALATRHAIALL